MDIIKAVYISTETHSYTYVIYMHNIKPTQKDELHTVVGFCTDYIK